MLPTFTYKYFVYSMLMVDFQLWIVNSQVFSDGNVENWWLCSYLERNIAEEKGWRFRYSTHLKIIYKNSVCSMRLSQSFKNPSYCDKLLYFVTAFDAPHGPLRSVSLFWVTGYLRHILARLDASEYFHSLENILYIIKVILRWTF